MKNILQTQYVVGKCTEPEEYLIRKEMECLHATCILEIEELSYQTLYLSITERREKTWKSNLNVMNVWS